MFNGTRERVTTYMLSGSGMAMQLKECKIKKVVQIDRVLDRGDGIVWSDKEKGESGQLFVAFMVVTRRKK